MARMEKLTRKQQWWLWGISAVVGLALAAILNAGYVATIGLVAGVGILLGFGFAAWSARQQPGRDSKR
jgi:Flp pilus assembly protein TadB